MDYVRRPYLTTARFFKDDPTEVTIRWYPAKRGAPDLGSPSPINSLDWNANPEIKQGVGEVFGAPRKFWPGKVIPEATGEHVCGTPDDFLLGEVLNEDLPPNVYGANLLPVCCNDPLRRRVDGGVVVGGRAVAVVRPVGFAPCASYWFVYPPTGLPRVMHREGTDFLWRYVPPDFDNLIASSTGASWRIDLPGVNTYFAYEWDGRGSRVFTDLFGVTSVTITCGLPPP